MYSDGLYTGPTDEPSLDKEIRRLGYNPSTLRKVNRSGMRRGRKTEE